jgi:hypothetical protein
VGIIAPLDRHHRSHARLELFNSLKVPTRLQIVLPVLEDMRVFLRRPSIRLFFVPRAIIVHQDRPLFTRCLVGLELTMIDQEQKLSKIAFNALVSLPAPQEQGESIIHQMSAQWVTTALQEHRFLPNSLVKLARIPI